MVAGGYKWRMAPAVQRALERRLREVYDVENALAQALPRLARGASNDDLSTLLLGHSRVTEKQLDRLRKVFDQIGKRPRRQSYAPLRALLEEAQKADDDVELIGAALAIEYLEQGLYRELMKLAEVGGASRAISKLEKSMGEESNAATELEELIESIGG